MAQASDTTNFTKVDASEGYSVNGTEVIGSSGKPVVPRISTIQETVALADFTDNEDATGEVELSTAIPEGAIVMQTCIDAVTGFAGDTSATVQIGDGTDVDRYNTGTPNVFATADHISAGAVSGTAYHAAAKTPTVTVTSNSDFSSVTAGEMTVTIFYYQSV